MASQASRLLLRGRSVTRLGASPDTREPAPAAPQRKPVCAAHFSVRRFLLTSAGVLTIAALASRKQGASGTKAKRQVRSISGDSMLNSHADLVQHLRSEGRLVQDRVRDAYEAVDRRYFVDPSTPKAFTYMDTPMPIGNDQTISAPHMHAACLDLLAEQLRPGASALDVGSGSGFLTAVMGRLVSPGGHVMGVEKWPDLAQRSVNSIRASSPDMLEGESPTVTIRAGNALGDILEDSDAQYDAIHVGAAAASMPDKLVQKLAPGGRMIIPVGGQHDFQTLQCVDKTPNGQVKEQPLMYVRYVPLVDAAMT